MALQLRVIQFVSPPTGPYLHDGTFNEYDPKDEKVAPKAMTEFCPVCICNLVHTAKKDVIKRRRSKAVSFLQLE